MEYIKNFIETNLMDYSIYLAVTYAGVVIAMAADLLTGVAKARRLGIRRNSRGYKRTCDKALKYFLPMICLTSIDLIASVLLPVPAMTMVFGAYCIFCELKSVMESTHEKAEIRKQIDDVCSLIEDSKSLADLLHGIIEHINKLQQDEKNN